MSIERILEELQLVIHDRTVILLFSSACCSCIETSYLSKHRVTYIVSVQISSIKSEKQAFK